MDEVTFNGMLLSYGIGSSSKSFKDCRATIEFVLLQEDHPKLARFLLSHKGIDGMNEKAGKFTLTWQDNE